MRKWQKVLLMSFALCLIAQLSFASVGAYEDGTRKGTATDLNFVGPTLTSDGSTITVDFSDKYGEVNLGIMDAWDGVAYPWDSRYTAEADNGASPYYQPVAGGADYIVFPGYTGVVTALNGSPMEYTFRVPDDYNDVATFVVYAQNSTISQGVGGAAAETTPNYIDWDIVINTDGSAVSTTRYDQTPVALDSDTNFQAVTLTYATPAAIEPGDTVTIRIWRVYEAAGSATGRDATSDLRVYGVAFRYLVQW